MIVSILSPLVEVMVAALIHWGGGKPMKHKFQVECSGTSPVGGGGLQHCGSCTVLWWKAPEIILGHFEGEVFDGLWPL